MDPKTKQLVERAEGLLLSEDDADRPDDDFVKALCSAVREQDKRARDAEVERDAFGERIKELEAKQLASWNEFENEALDAIGSEVIGMTVDAGSDIPGMIRRLHDRYRAEIRREQALRIEAEKQLATYKRITSIKKK